MTWSQGASSWLGESNGEEDALKLLAKRKGTTHLFTVVLRLWGPWCLPLSPLVLSEEVDLMGHWLQLITSMWLVSGVDLPMSPKLVRAEER